MSGYLRPTLAGGYPSKIYAMAADVAAHHDAGAVALREFKFVWAQWVPHQDSRPDAVRLHIELAAHVSTKEGSAAACYLLVYTFENGYIVKYEKALFACSQRDPQASKLGKAFILLGYLYVPTGDHFQALATNQCLAEGCSPAVVGILDEGKQRIAKLI